MEYNAHAASYTWKVLQDEVWSPVRSGPMTSIFDIVRCNEPSWLGPAHSPLSLTSSLECHDWRRRMRFLFYCSMNAKKREHVVAA